MPITSVSEAEPAEELSTQPETRRSGGRLGRFLNRIKLGLGGNNEDLVLQNKTEIAWRIYHDYHQLGIVDKHEQRTFRLVKRGTLNVRPLEGDNVEYLVLSLSDAVHYVRIYQRRYSNDVEVYEMECVR
jgi:hypothetical protein